MSSWHTRLEKSEGNSIYCMIWSLYQFQTPIKTWEMKNIPKVLKLNGKIRLKSFDCFNQFRSVRNMPGYWKFSSENPFSACIVSRDRKMKISYSKRGKKFGMVCIKADLQFSYRNSFCLCIWIFSEISFFSDRIIFATVVDKLNLELSDLQDLHDQL